jgi:flagellar hook-length control protein FliK
VVVSATLLPFEPARVSTAPRFESSSGWASGTEGFAGAMNGALAAPRETSRPDDAPRTSRRPEPAKAREAAERPAAPSRRATASARGADGRKTDRANEAAADDSTTERSADGPSDGVASERAEERAEAKAGGEAEQAGETAAETPVETIAEETMVASGTAPLPEAEGEDTESEDGEESLARGRRWVAPAAAPADEDGEEIAARGAARQGAGGTASGLKVGHAIQEARAEGGATPGEAFGAIAQAVVAAAHADATADGNAAGSVAGSGAPLTQAVETAQAAAKTASAAEAATAIETAIAAVETVAGMEPSADGGGTGMGESETREQAQPKPQAPGAQGNGGPTASVGGAETGVRFTVNSAAGNAAYTSAAPRSEEAAVLPQIVKSIRLQAVQGTTEARVQLKPEHLGNLNITLKVEHNQVTATIQADVAAVRRWIESHESSLRQALSEQGLQLASLVVRPDDEQASSDERNGERPGRQPRRRSWRDEEQTFEVLV